MTLSEPALEFLPIVFSGGRSGPRLVLTVDKLLPILHSNSSITIPESNVYARQWKRANTWCSLAAGVSTIDGFGQLGPAIHVT